MSTSFSSDGIGRMWRRRGLVLVIYLIGLAVAFLVGAGFIRLLSFEIGPTGFSRHLLERFDIVVWADFWREIASGLAAIVREAVVAGLLMMFWKVATSVGLIHALHGDGKKSFWEGVSRYTVRGLGLGVLYLLPMLILAGILIAIAYAMTKSMGEVGTFWTWAVVYPLIVIVSVACFDLFHDYARMHLVLRGTTIRRAWLEGIKWPFKHFRAVLLYKIWFWISAILWLAVLVVGFYMPDQTVGAVLIAFLLQQVLILGRTAANVSWIGAEVAFFEQFPAPSVEPEGEFADVSTELEDTDPAIGAV
ncbi:MAG: hypothetical protein WBW88_00620 [Rhodothermales bacterium]